jgi:hypothetical protein
MTFFISIADDSGPLDADERKDPQIVAQRVLALGGIPTDVLMASSGLGNSQVLVRSWWKLSVPFYCHGSE